jgi:hypothetical protein
MVRHRRVREIERTYGNFLRRDLNSAIAGAVIRCRTSKKREL